MQWNQFTPGPVQAITNFYNDQSIHLLRLDQLKSWASGNKYYKLKYPLQFVLENGIQTIVSKGGMFSNHLAALAEACHAFQIKLVAVVRSFAPDELNPTMKRLKELGSQIEFVSPEAYNLFDEQAAHERYPEAVFIDEGGLSPEGIRGSAEIASEIDSAKFNHVVIAGGSMCTAVGLISALPTDTMLHIVPAWKGCSKEYVENILANYEIQPACSWNLWPDYHFGGFGKFNQELIDFMTGFTKRTGIPLDPVYTGKMLFAITYKIENGYFNKGDNIVAIHTGGLQGLTGYVHRFPEAWEEYAGLIKEESHS